MRRAVNPPAAANATIFYGWIVVASSFTILFVAFGTAYSFTTFIEPLQAEFAATRGSLSLVFAIAGALYFTVGALGGPLADRFGHRWVVSAGIVILAAGYLLASTADQLWQVYVGYSLGVGIGIGLAYTPAVGAVQPWFVRRRGLASGLAVSGIGIGTLCAAPFAALLIHWLGWRAAYGGQAAVVLLFGIVAALLLDAAPHKRGLHADGAVGKDRPQQATRTPLKAVLRNRAFWMLYGANGTLSTGMLIPFVHFVPYAQDAGIDRAVAVSLFGLVGLGSALGRFFIAGVADRIGRARVLTAMCLGLALAYAWWLFAFSAWQLAFFAALFGTLYGGFVALLPTVAADRFGAGNVSGVIGLLYTSVAPGFLLGPTLAGVAFDLWQSYTLPIIGAVLVSLVASAFTMMLHRQGQATAVPE